MSNPPGPDQPDDAAEASEPADQSATEATAPAESPAEPPTGGDPATEAMPTHPEHEPATEIIAPATSPPSGSAPEQPAERRFTAPSGFDAGTTQKIDTPAEPATEVLATPEAHPGIPPASGGSEQYRAAGPQTIPPRGEAPRPPRVRRSWGWVIALLLVIAALVAVAVLGTVLLTRKSDPKASQQDQVRSTIQNFDIAVQNGDLATLRGITCGVTRDSYVNYDDRAWSETHSRVAAAKQYPVVASIDQVVVNGDHAEANVTTFMAYAPQTRSTRSFDLQFRDDQWKICQASTS